MKISIHAPGGWHRDYQTEHVVVQGQYIIFQDVHEGQIITSLPYIIGPGGKDDTVSFGPPREQP